MQNNNYNNGMYEGIVSEVWQTKSGKKLGYIKYDTDKSVFFYNENSPGFSRNILNADTLEVDDKVKWVIWLQLISGYFQPMVEK